MGCTRISTRAQDHLHARRINLHILSGICAGLHRPNGATIADKILFMVAEVERDLIRERTLDGLHDAEAQGRRGGRPDLLFACPPGTGSRPQGG